MNNQIELERIIQERLSEIKMVPKRDPRIAARARAQFLVKAVSANEFQRHKGWISIFRKEQFAMNIVLSILVIAGLLFGGGATVNAAQDDLPGEPLYELKTWSEDVSLNFQNNAEGKVNRLMELARNRVQEMTQLIESGQTPPDQVSLRLEQHLQQALQLCSNMDDATLEQTLLRLRDQLREQDRDMERLQLHTSQDAQPILERTRTMIQQRLQLVDSGLLDHEIFRNAVQNGFRYGQTETPHPFLTSTPLGQNGQQNGQDTAEPDANNDGNGPGPNMDPGGPNPNVTPAPDHDGSGQGTGPGNGNSDGNGSGGNGSGGNDSGKNGSGGTESGGSGSDNKGP